MSFASAESAMDRSVQLCAFHVGGTEFVIDLRRVEEILRPQVTTPLPEAPPWVAGVVSLRGNLLPVVNLRVRLGIETSERLPKARLLVCWIGKRRVGFLVDRVAEVLRLRKEDLRPPPPLLAPTAAAYVVGVCGPPERLRLLLNLKALLSRSEREGAAPRRGS